MVSGFLDAIFQFVKDSCIIDDLAKNCQDFVRRVGR